MKKLFLAVSAFAIFSMFTGATTFVNIQNAPATTDLMVSSSRIQVVFWTGSTGSVKVNRNATYDEDTNTITIGKDGPYKVQENPYYETNDKTGSYRYVAAGKYYFNL